MKRRGGFTSAELMVVMGMIALAVAVLGIIYRGAHERARTISCRSNVRQLGLSSRMYMQDNAGRMPTLPSPAESYPGLGNDPMSVAEPQTGGWEICGPLMVYVKNQQVFRCPDAPPREKPPECEAEDSRNGSDGWYQVDYVFNLAARSDDPPTELLVADDAPDRHHGTWNGVRVDGAAVRLPADRWDEFWAPGLRGDW